MTTTTTTTTTRRKPGPKPKAAAPTKPECSMLIVGGASPAKGRSVYAERYEDWKRIAKDRGENPGYDAVLHEALYAALSADEGEAKPFLEELASIAQKAAQEAS